MNFKNSLCSFAQKEDLLSKKLRSCCDSKGREIFILESANVLNELGLLYQQKSPDKISLIQSAALLNAAIVRQSSSKKFANDLKQLCNQVLSCANASKQNVNLVDIAKDVKQMVVKMREETISALRNIKRTPDSVTLGIVLHEIEKVKINRVKSLQSQIAQQYTDIMAYISNRCIEIMGKPPCKYSLVGMGSLARKEITPYSDFEHVIILETMKLKKPHSHHILEYFRWYSTIFHIIVINLQETIVPSVCIRGLNDFSKPSGDWFFDKITTRGISFDGMMPHACKFPLGRTHTTAKKAFTVELIKPLSEMVRYLDVQEDLKNGYKLADILTKTCYVSGEESLYQLFLIQILQNQSRLLQKLMVRDQIFSQLSEDLIHFNLDSLLNMFEFSKTLNIKQVVYRSSTLFVSALGRICGLTNNSSFEIIEDLHQLEKIDDDIAHRLSFAVALACHLRLQQYMSKKSQDDYVVQVSEQLLGAEKLHELLKTVSKRELVDYFCTIFHLHNFMSGTMSDVKIIFSDKNSAYARIYILQMLCMNDEIISVGEECLRDRSINTENDFQIASCVGIAWKRKLNYEKSLIALKRALHSPFAKTCEVCNTRYLHYHLVFCKLYLGCFKEAIDETNSILNSMKFGSYTFNFLMPNGIANACVGRFYAALRSFRDLKIQDNLNAFQSDDKLLRYAIMLQQVSQCLLGIGRPQNALHWIFEALEIFDNFAALAFKHNCYNTISDIYSSLGQRVQAKHYENLHFEKISGQPKEVIPVPTAASLVQFETFHLPLHQWFKTWGARITWRKHIGL